MSVQDLFKSYFDVAFAAPDGVKRLRELILSVAMRGLLVPQDPSDRPASELLMEIEAERRRLVKEGKLKKSKPLPEIMPDEVPYDLPDSWEWVRIRHICHDFGQKKPNQNFTYIDVGSIDNIAGRISDNVQILQPNEAPSRARKIVKKGTVIYSTVRPYLLNIAIIEQQYKYESIASTAFAILHPLTGVHNRFIFYYLKSPGFVKFVEGQMKGVAYPAINDNNFYQGVFPLPPIEEQKRIVEKIDRLMEQCDRLEQLRTEREQKRLTAHAAVNHRLLNAKDDRELQAAWGFIRDRFGELYAVKENVSELRKAILQLAVMGKLVPQDPRDRPASELLKEIQAEKQRLIKEGKIKKGARLTEIKSTEIPYLVPYNWSWIRLDDITQKIGSGSTPRGGKNAYIGGGVPFLRSQNIWNNGMKLNEVALIPESIHQKMSATKVFAKDILLNITGASLGRCTVVPDDFEEANVSQHVMIIRCVRAELRFFLHLLFLSPFCQAMIWGRQVGMSREGLSKKVLEQFPLPLPPLPEQKRIVAKVDHLMHLCDQLETNITQQTTRQTQLLNAILANLNP